jgi:hypothetical protein
MEMENYPFKMNVLGHFGIFGNYQDVSLFGNDLS